MSKTTTSRKVIATHDTADFSDCVATGYKLTHYADGRVSAESVSRWSGSTTGARWTTGPGYLGEGESLPDAARRLIEQLGAAEEDHPQGDDWRQTRRGVEIR